MKYNTIINLTLTVVILVSNEEAEPQIKFAEPLSS